MQIVSSTARKCAKAVRMRSYLIKRKQYNTQRGFARLKRRGQLSGLSLKKR